MKRGVVMHVNRRRCIGVALVPDNGYLVFDWTVGPEPRLNDVIEGTLGRAGGARLHNRTTGKGFLAFVHIVGCSLQDAKHFAE
jgi:hypothetical protein